MFWCGLRYFGNLWNSSRGPNSLGFASARAAVTFLTCSPIFDFLCSFYPVLSPLQNGHSENMLIERHWLQIVRFAAKRIRKTRFFRFSREPNVLNQSHRQKLLIFSFLIDRYAYCEDLRHQISAKNNMQIYANELKFSEIHLRTLGVSELKFGPILTTFSLLCHPLFMVPWLLRRTRFKQILRSYVAFLELSGRVSDSVKFSAIDTKNTMINAIIFVVRVFSTSYRPLVWVCASGRRSLLKTHQSGTAVSL